MRVLRDEEGTLCTIAFSWESMPTCANLVRSFYSMKQGRAFGEGLIAAEMCKTFAFDLALVLHPLLVKSYAHVRPALQRRGGMLQELYK